jgi:hypothetical protein
MTRFITTVRLSSDKYHGGNWTAIADDVHNGVKTSGSDFATELGAANRVGIGIRIGGTTDEHGITRSFQNKK